MPIPINPALKPDSTQKMWTDETKKLVIKGNPSFDTFDKLQNQKDTVIQHSVVNKAYEDYSRRAGLMNYYSSYANQIYGFVPTNKFSRLQMYRNMAMYPEVADAIDEICEACTQSRDENGQLVRIELSRGSRLTDDQKDVVRQEFEEFIALFNIDRKAFEFFYNFCIDGEVTWENVLDKNNPRKGVIGVNRIQPECYEYFIDQQGRKSGIILNTSITPIGNYNNPVNISSLYSQSQTGASAGYQSQSYYTNSPENVLVLPFKQVTHICTGTFDHTGLVVFPVLEKARVAYRQLSTIEAAIIVYRLVRAPERLIFNVDTGTVSGPRAEQLVNKMMERYNVKHVWDQSTGSVSPNYDPHQMLECLRLSTMIPLLDGRTISLAEIIKEYEEGKQLWAYSCCPTTGKFSPGKISWAGVTRKNAKVVKITFDNGKSIVCTPDHHFPVWKRGRVEAQDLVPNDSVISFNTRGQKIAKNSRCKEYQQIFDHELNKWVFTHQVVSADCNIESFCFDEKYINNKKGTVHHKDFERYNNSPTNLVKMNYRDHFAYHSKNAHIRWGNPENIRIIKEQKSHKFSVDLGNTLIKLMRDNNIFELKDVVNFINQKDTTFLSEYRQLHLKNNNYSHVEGSIQPRYLLSLVKYCGFSTFREFRKFVNPGQKLGDKSRTRVYTHEMLTSLIDLTNKTGLNTILDVVDYVNTKDPECEFMQVLRKENSGCTKTITSLSRKHLTKLVSYCGFKDFRTFIKNKDLHNHRVVSVEPLEETMDTGTLTIDQDHEIHEYHTFATDAGVYTYNSFWFAKPQGSTGTDVSTLSTGQNLGTLDDLQYFQKKLFTALKVPWSRRSTEGGSSNSYNPDSMTPDEERFTNFVMRLQNQFAEGIYTSFITHLELKGMWEQFGMSGREFTVSLCPPTNYEIYRRQKMLEQKMNMYLMFADRDELSQENAQKQFLGWTDVEISENKDRRRQEKIELARLEWMISQIVTEGKEPKSPYDTEETPAEEPPPVEEAPAEEVPAEEAPAEEPTAPEAPAEEPSAEEAPSEENK